MKPVVFVTGATSGFGWAIAKTFAQNNYDVVITGRRKERLQQLKSELEAMGASVESIEHDVRNPQVLSDWVKKSEFTQRVKVLINNAGLAKGMEPMTEAHLDDWDTMIDTNIKGLLYCTRLLMPFIKNQRGDIINIGSVAGRWVYPGGGVYCATKFAVRALTEGLRMDLHGSGVRVMNIEPGRAETEFSLVRLGDKEKAKKVYEHFRSLQAQDIADCALWMVQRPSHVNIQEIVVFPTDQGSMTQFFKTT